MTEAAVWRWRHLAVCAALTALAVLQEPGRIVPDTKLDLSLDPAGFLARATSVWDETGFAGQLQNQAYGYLEPIGPFFVLGNAVTEPWVVQRLWWALVLVTAFLGLRRLAAELAIGSSATRVVAALAFALSPRVLSVLGPVSAEAWPMALAPWVLVPLVGVVRGRRGPVAGGLAAAVPVVLMGGVNAALDLTAVLPAAIYLACQGLGPRLRRTWAAWGAATVAGTLWWVVPLVILGRYSPPFLDYIESAATTTLVTSLPDTLRGASHWVAYLSPEIGGTWQAGRDLVVRPPLVLYTMLVAAAGGAGLALRGLRERRWLVVCLAVSLAVMVGGHAAALGSPVDAAVRALLDGPLAPLRNVHKFDVGVRIPLVLGLAHLLASAPALFERFAARRALMAGVVGATVIAVVGTAVPAAAGRLPSLGAFREVPAYWEDAATWLEDNPGGRTLLAPESRFATYAWGFPADEPLQALTTADWDVHNAVPLTPPGHIRLLDGVDRAFASGAAVPGLAATLSRAGVGYVLVRNDLDVRRAGAPRPELVRAVLEASDGFTRVTGFGPVVGPTDPALGVSLRGPAVQRSRVLEVWRVDPAPSAATSTADDDVVEVAGGPEGLLPVAAAGLLPPTTATVLAVDRSGPPPRRVVLTDSLARREADVGRSDAEYSEVLGAEDDGVLGRPAREYELTDDPVRETTATWLGARAVRATSTSASVGGPEAARPWEGAAQAFDGDPETAWWPSTEDEEPGFEVRYPRAVDLGDVVVRLVAGPDGALPASVRLRTDGGVTDLPVRAGVARGRPFGTTTTLEVETAPGEDGGPRVGVAEVTAARAPVRAARRTPVLDLVNRTAAVVLTADPGRRDGCVGAAADLYCSPSLVARGEEDGGVSRVVPVEGRDDFTVEAAGRPVGGPALDDLAADAADLRLRARASSSAVPALGGSAFAAVDGRDGTVWTPAADDAEPTLTLSWDDPVAVRGVRLDLSDDARASRPRTVRVTVGGVDYVRGVDPDSGVVEVPSTRARSVRVTFLDEGGRFALDPVTGEQTRLPVGVAEVSVPGVRSEPADLDARVDLPCGAGPTLTVDGRSVPTAVATRLRDLVTSAPLTLLPCEDAPVTLADGDRVVAMRSTDTVAPERIVLTSTRWTAPAPGAPVPVELRAARAAFAGLPDDASVVARTVNVNAGWAAADGVRPVTVDGWRQGWRVPAGTTAVATSFTADGLYRGVLGVGLVLAALVVVLGGLAWRRSVRVVGTPVALAPAGVPLVARYAGAGLLLGVAGGLAGLVLAGAAALALGRLPADRARAVRPIAVGAAWVTAAVVMASAGWGSPSHATLAPVAQALALAGLAALVVPRPGSRPDPSGGTGRHGAPRRRAG